jgi:hypothetical protein
MDRHGFVAGAHKGRPCALVSTMISWIALHSWRAYRIRPYALIDVDIRCFRGGRIAYAPTRCIDNDIG